MKTLQEKKNALIDYLSEEFLFNRIEESLFIGDILGSPQIVICVDEEERKDKIFSLWQLWYELGITKSLDEIFESEKFKDKETQDLFNFLYDLFENEL